MPRVRPIVPVQDEQGKNYAVAEEVDVDEATATAWHNAGKASLVDDEHRNAEIAAEGNYTARVTREPQPEQQPAPEPLTAPEQEPKP
jgi:hypothetical protein